MINYVVGVVCSAPGISFMFFYPQPLVCCYECYERKINHHQQKITFFVDYQEWTMFRFLWILIQCVAPKRYVYRFINPMNTPPSPKYG